MISYKDFVANATTRSDESGLTTVTEEATKELYEDIPYSKIAEIIREYREGKITDSLIESYIDLVVSNEFSVDPVVMELRSINRLDRLVEGKLDYTLKDGTVIAIEESTQKYLNNLLSNHNDVVDYMKESKDNFMQVLRQIEE